MKHRKLKLTYLLLIPLLFVVVLQGLIPLLILISSGTKTTMEQNAVDIDNNLVENHRVVLQNAMVNQWSTIRNETAGLNQAFTAFLQKENVTAEQFRSSRSLQRKYARQVFPNFVDYLRTDFSCGVYLILGNSGGFADEEDYVGFFLRDSDPAAKTETNSDLLLERGDKTLAHETGIALNSSWSPRFHFLGSGTRTADNFFYQPYLLAQKNKTVALSSLGYWSTPFILEDHPMDNHKMITYSVPLICDGEVYGVIGTEISTSYLANNYLSVWDLDSNQNAGYAIALRQTDGSYQTIAGKGSLYDTIQRDSETFFLKETDHEHLMEVENSKVGSQKIYAVTSDMTLYNRNVPYDNTNWVLCGFISEDSVYGVGESLYNSILITIAACTAGGLILMAIVVYFIIRPIYRLMDSIRGGMEGLKGFRPSNIAEIDELHDTAQALSESELYVTTQLEEEKERYRIALSTSRDMFFTYLQEQQTMEIVNSHSDKDGVWKISDFWDTFVVPVCTAEGKKILQKLLHSTEDTLYGQVQLMLPGKPEGLWVEIQGQASTDLQTGQRKVVGFTRDIHKQKMQELKQAKLQNLDPVTNLYRLQPGIAAIGAAREMRPSGVLLLLDFCRFSRLNQCSGLLFGNVILQDFAKLLYALCEECFHGAVRIRSGGDSILIWLPDSTLYESEKLRIALKDALEELIRPSALELRFHTGIVVADKEPTQTLLWRVRSALNEAKTKDIDTVVWHPGLPAGKEFSPILSQGYASHMNLTSLTLNLFDRSVSITAALDLTSYHLAAQFALKDLVITSFRGDYLSGIVEYRWKQTDDATGANSVYHCSEEQYRTMNKVAQSRSLHTTEELAPIFKSHAIDCNQPGFVFPMLDDGNYVGSIFFFGIDSALMARKEQRELLEEIGTIIQNRINQEHHDQSAQAKSDFLSRMSHEIRTPMNGIIGMTEIALKENQSEQVRLDCLKKVRSSSDYLLGLLNDILDMSKIESGKMTLTLADFNLSQLLSDLHTVLDSNFESKEQTFRTEISLTHHWFHGDALRISQVLINLLGNAVKYSDRNTEILLTATETNLSAKEAQITFAVIDQGIGIAPEDQKRVFQTFEQLDTPTAYRKGSGLGLAISNRLVHMMNSEIQLESELGKGSTFSFVLTLPIAQPQQLTEAAPEEQVDLTGIHALVAEDNLLNMEIICAFLKDLGCITDCAYNGQEALNKFNATPAGTYQIIFMDVMMPVLDGLEATHLIRTSDHADSKTIPIVAVSANAFDEDIKRSLASGMNAHLSKPIEPKKLKELMAQFFRKPTA